MSERKVTPREVRNMPEFAKVTLHGTDRYGYPTRMLCFVHELPNCRKVLQPVGAFAEGFLPIRLNRGQYFTVEEGET